MRLILGVVLCLSMAAGGDGLAQSDSEPPFDDAANLALDGPSAPTDDVLTLDEAATSAEPATPLAFGTIAADGGLLAGSDNVSATFVEAAQRYEIEIAGTSYHYLRFATLVTPVASTSVSCMTSSVIGRLVVVCADGEGVATPAAFAFVTYEP